jgi:hypothetical protein
MGSLMIQASRAPHNVRPFQSGTNAQVCNRLILIEVRQSCRVVQTQMVSGTTAVTAMLLRRKEDLCTVYRGLGEFEHLNFEGSSGLADAPACVSLDLMVTALCQEGIECPFRFHLHKAT